MRTRDSLTLTMLRAASGFLQEYGDKLPTVAASNLARELDDTISTLYDHTTAQVVHTMHASGLVRTQESLRTVLREDRMKPIARIAYADLPHTPEFRVLRMPAGRPGTDRLTSAARAMVYMAERFVDTFLSGGMPLTFIDDTHAAIRALLKARDEATLARASQHGATLGIDAAIVEGNRVIKDLTNLIASDPRADVAIVAHWRSVSAKRRLGRPRKE